MRVGEVVSFHRSNALIESDHDYGHWYTADSTVLCFFLSWMMFFIQ